MTDKQRILVIDDEPSARETVSALLHNDPYELVFAESGRLGLELLGATPFDLIICDVMMPGMDGFEVCATVKAHPEWRFTPLVLLTALDSEEDMVRGIAAGADEFLSKPIHRVALRTRVRAMLRVRDHYNELRKRTELGVLLRERRQRISEAAKLSPREREVLELLLLGRTYDEIGAVLGIAGRTAKYHQTNILEKLGADSRLDLMRVFL